MDGFELTINHQNQSWLNWAKNVLDVESENGDLLNDAIYKHNRSIEDRFNCTISVAEQTKIETTTIQNEVMAGDSNYDLWLFYDVWALNVIEYLLPWENIPYIDLDKQWWNPLASEVFNIGGNQYAAAGSYSLSVLSRASGYIFNKKIYEELNLDTDMYQLAADGKWTIDQFHNVAKSAYYDLNGDTMMDDSDRYGVSGSWKEFANRLMLGAGIQYITKDDEGYPTFALPTDENSINKILKLYDLFTQSEIFNIPYTTNVNGQFSKGDFEKGGTLFTLGNLKGLEDMRTLDIDVGFVPCPKYDEAQE